MKCVENECTAIAVVRGFCKRCYSRQYMRGYLKGWKKRNRSKVRKYKRTYYKKNKSVPLSSLALLVPGASQGRPQRLYASEEHRAEQKRYDKLHLSKEEHERMRQQQHDLCAICKGSSADTRKLVIDHCHKTQKVRGLLCNLCNTALGFLGDSIERALAAAEYLRLHSS